MKKAKIIALGLLIVSMFIFSGCGAGDYLDDTKMAVEEYYDDYNSGDYDDIVDTVHPALLDIMDEETFMAFFEARTYYFGAVTDYKITSTNISYENGVTYVELGMDTEYESGETFAEVLEYVFEEKGNPQMIAIDAPTE